MADPFAHYRGPQVAEEPEHQSFEPDSTAGVYILQPPRHPKPVKFNNELSAEDPPERKVQQYGYGESQHPSATQYGYGEAIHIVPEYRSSYSYVQPTHRIPYRDSIPAGPKFKWWLPADGIREDIIRAEIQRYLGADAVVKLGKGLGQDRVRDGYWIAASKNLTPSMIADLRAHSATYETGDQAYKEYIPYQLKKVGPTESANPAKEIRSEANIASSRGPILSDPGLAKASQDTLPALRLSPRLDGQDELPDDDIQGPDSNLPSPSALKLRPSHRDYQQDLNTLTDGSENVSSDDTDECIFVQEAIMPISRYDMITSMKHDFVALALRAAKSRIDGLVQSTQNPEGSSSSSERSRDSSNTSTQSSKSAAGKSKGKRNLETTQQNAEDLREDGEDQSEDENDQGPAKRLKAPQQDLFGLKFACHFYKHDRKRYSSGACVGAGWISIHRLKEHLLRKHKLPIHCHRCCTIFKDEDDLIDHSRGDPCEISDNRLEGLNGKQIKVIRSRKIQPGQTDEDRWKVIYSLLFPKERIPPPYCGPSDQEAQMILDDFKSFLEEDLPNRVVEAIRPVLTESPHLVAEIHSAVMLGIQTAYTELVPSGGRASNALPISTVLAGASADTTNSFLDRGDQQVETIDYVAMDYPVPIPDLGDYFGYALDSFEIPDNIPASLFPF